MPRGRDRGFLELWSPLTTASKTAPIAYFTIARTFEQIDQAMLDEMQDDISRHIQPGDDSTQRPTSLSRFNELRAHEDTESYVEVIKKGTSHTSSKTDVVAYLTDTKCLTVWSWVHRAVLEYQGASVFHYATPWAHAKACATKILNLAQGVMEIYCSDECQNLTIHGDGLIVAGIEAKLRALLLFDSIYSRPTDEDTKKHFVPKSHQFQLLYDNSLRVRRNAVKARRNGGYDRTHQNTENRNASLVTATMFTIAISAIFLGLAFHTSTNNAPGSTSDADFWLLIQNSLMPVLGLITTSLISLIPKRGKQPSLGWPRFLTWTVAILGLGCALNAPLLYVRAPLMYSALMSFLASAAQACMVMQLALFVDVGGENAKMD